MDPYFAPTHELFDANGESRGLYIKQGSAYASADVWFEGGRALLESEIIEWGWTRTTLNDAFREHYTLVHGATGSDCVDGCDEHASA